MLMKSLIYIGLILFSINMHAQLLSVSDASNYLSELINEDLQSNENIHGGEKKIFFENGERETLIIRYVWENNESVIFPDYWDTEVNYNEYEINVDQVSTIEKYETSRHYSVIVKCKDGSKNCISVRKDALLSHYTDGFCDNPNGLNHFDFVNLYYSDTKKLRDKAYNGFRYILNEIRRNVNAEELESPFSSGINSTSDSNNKVVVNLGALGGVSTLFVDLGVSDVEFILDSGASEVSITKSIESELLANNIISKEDYLEPGLYTIADGSVVKGDRFIIPYISIDGVKVPNVNCNVNTSEDVLLLGKSFLNRFKNWKIDNEFNQLILEY